MIETPPEALQEINDIIQNFIWEGKTAKIAQKTLINNIDNGGLKLCYFLFKVDSLKLSLIKRLCDDTDANWNILPKFLYGCDDLNIYFSVNHKIINKKNKIPSFYKDIHDLFMGNLKKEPRTAQDILEQSIWINKDITINNKCIDWKSCKNAGIFYKQDK